MRRSCDCNPLQYRFRDGKPIDYWSGDARSTSSANKNDGQFIGPSEIIATPVFYKNRVYVAIGQDPMHGRGHGMLNCIDATKTGDISKAGKIWTFDKLDRSLSTVSIADGLLYIADLPGRLYCLDAETGECYWIHDTKQQVWGSTLVADGKVYLGTRKALWVFAAGKEERVLIRFAWAARSGRRRLRRTARSTLPRSTISGPWPNRYGTRPAFWRRWPHLPVEAAHDRASRPNKPPNTLCRSCPKHSCPVVPRLSSIPGHGCPSLLLRRHQVRDHVRLLGLAMMVGVVAGLGAILFYAATRAWSITHWASWPDIIRRYGQGARWICRGSPSGTSPFAPGLLLIPTVGGILSGWLVYTLRPRPRATAPMLSSTPTTIVRGRSARGCRL